MKSNLKKLRKEAGLTLDQLGHLCSVTRQRVHQLEQDTNPTLKTAYEIADMLGVAVEDIWPYEGIK